MRLGVTGLTTRSSDPFLPAVPGKRTHFCTTRPPPQGPPPAPLIKEASHTQVLREGSWLKDPSRGMQY